MIRHEKKQKNNKIVKENDCDDNEIYDSDINLMLDNEIKKMLDKKSEPIKEILVLSGGGVKGVAQMGALHCLKKNNMLNNIKTIAGSSIGSVVGTLFSIGYHPMELFKFIKLLNLSKLQKLEPHNVITKYGLDDGSRMMLVLKKLMNAKGYSEDITFDEFYKKSRMNLIITGSCINDKKIYYFSKKNYPMMKVCDAIRISISLPILFTPCVFEEKIFIDGGCIDNFPIHLFDDQMEKVIGIYVTEVRSIVKDIKFIEDYLINMIESLFEGMTQRYINSFHKHVIKIRCTKTSESHMDLINMFDEGFTATQKKIDDGDLFSI